MKSIKNYILNVQIQRNSETSETVPIVQYMNKEVANEGKSQSNSDSVQATRVPYRKLK